MNFQMDLNKIVVPIDSSLETRQKLTFTTKIAKYFGSEMHILSLYSTSIKAVRHKVDNYTQQVKKYLEEENVNFVIEKVDADNITNSTINYAKEN